MTERQNADLARRFLEARSARGVSIKAAALEMGRPFSMLIRLNRGDGLTQASLDSIEAWIAQPVPVEAVDPNEEWRTLPGFEAEYEVSNLGRVRSLARQVPHPSGFPLTLISRIMRQTPDPKSGHLKVSLSRGGVEYKRWVHQLVLEAFVGPMPEGMEGCHYDGDSSNNRVENLRWDTRAANMADAIRHGTHPSLRRRAS